MNMNTFIHWWNNPLTPSITHWHTYNRLFFHLQCGKDVLQESNGTFCALHHWLYFMLCHSECPWSSFPLFLTHSPTFFPNLSLFFPLCLLTAALSHCLFVWLSLSLSLAGAVMSIHSRAQRFEVLPNGTLVIQNVQLQDRGTYICSAQSFLGRDRWDYWYQLWILMHCIPFSHNGHGTQNFLY